MSCFCILRRKEDCAATEVYMLYLNPHEFADSTAEFINHLKHQFMSVIVNTVEEILEFVNCEVADDLAKTFIPFWAFAFSARNLRVQIILVVDLHLNVKSLGLINISVSVSVAILNNPYGIQQKTKSIKNRKI